MAKKFVLQPKSEVSIVTNQEKDDDTISFQALGLNVKEEDLMIKLGDIKPLFFLPSPKDYNLITLCDEPYGCAVANRFDFWSKMCQCEADNHYMNYILESFIHTTAANIAIILENGIMKELIAISSKTYENARAELYNLYITGNYNVMVDINIPNIILSIFQKYINFDDNYTKFSSITAEMAAMLSLKNANHMYDFICAAMSSGLVDHNILGSKICDDLKINPSVDVSGSYYSLSLQYLLEILNNDIARIGEIVDIATIKALYMIEDLQTRAEKNSVENINGAVPPGVTITRF